MQLRHCVIPESLQAMGPTSLSQAKQQQHIEALEVLQQCLTEVCQDQPDMLAGLCVFLHHPSSNSWIQTEGVSEDFIIFHASLEPCHTLCIQEETQCKSQCLPEQGHCRLPVNILPALANKSVKIP